MKTVTRLFAGAALAAVVLALGAGAAQPDKKKLKLAVIPKGTTHVFWKSVEKGAKKAGEDLGVEIVWKGPLKESDRAQQIQLVQQFTSQATAAGEGGISGIVLAPLDAKALAASVKAAGDKKLPVVIFDSALDGEAGKDFVSFVATNNEAAGGIGGAHLAKLLGTSGNAVILRYQVGSASTESREKGAIDALKKAGVTIASDNRYAGPTSGEAKTQALNMIDTIKQAQGVFCPNESSTLGMLLALRQAGLVGKVKLVGFDSSPPLVEALRKGEIDALVVQDPNRMGYKAVECLVKHIRGEKVDVNIDTGAVLVTKENIDTPEVKKLLE
jgi:ribose transport system substrate-binding protein